MASTVPAILDHGIFTLGNGTTYPFGLAVNSVATQPQTGDLIVWVFSSFDNNGKVTVSGNVGWTVLANLSSGNMVVLAKEWTADTLGFGVTCTNTVTPGNNGMALDQLLIRGARLPAAALNGEENPAGTTGVPYPTITFPSTEHLLPLLFTRFGVNSTHVFPTWAGRGTVQIYDAGGSDAQGWNSLCVSVTPAVLNNFSGTFAAGSITGLSSTAKSSVAIFGFPGRPILSAPSVSLPISQTKNLAPILEHDAPPVTVPLAQHGTVVNAPSVHAPAVNLGTLHESSLASPAPNNQNEFAAPSTADIARSEWLTPDVRLFIADGITGQVVDDLPLVGNPTWSRQLNDAGTLDSISVDLLSLTDASKTRLRQPWRWIVGYAEGDYICQMGYLVTAAQDDSQGGSSLTLTVKTLWDMLAKRVVINPGFDLLDARSDVVFGDTSPDIGNQKLSLQGIARRVIELVTTASPNAPLWDLPVLLPASIPANPGNARTYAAADLTAADSALTDLTGVLNGPEVELSPEYADASRTTVQWQARIGNARLGQLGFAHAWDYQQALRNLSVTYDGTDMEFGTWATGQDTRQAADPTNGTSASGTLLHSYFEDDTYPAGGWPMLLSVDTSHSDVTVQATIDGYAKADVQGNLIPVYTGTMVVSSDGTNNLGLQTGSPDMSQVSTGDTAFIQVQNHPWLPDGRYGCRVLEISSGSDLYTRSVSIQLLDVPTP